MSRDGGSWSRYVTVAVVLRRTGCVEGWLILVAEPGPDDVGADSRVNDGTRRLKMCWVGVRLGAVSGGNDPECRKNLIGRRGKGSREARKIIRWRDNERREGNEGRRKGADRQSTSTDSQRPA